MITAYNVCGISSVSRKKNDADSNEEQLMQRVYHSSAASLWQNEVMQSYKSRREVRKVEKTFEIK